MGWFQYAVIVSLLSYYIQPISEALKLIKPGQKLGVSDTLESKGGFYELGFFAPDTNSNKLYLGIWFTKTKTKAVVWVSNRDEPFTSSSPLLIFDKDEENLIALDGKSSYQVTNTTEKGKNAQVVLLDSGNLVMQDEDSNVLWESFDYPTDTLLAGMKLGYNNTIGKKWDLYSWKRDTDPSKGSVQMTLDDSGSSWTIIIRHKAQFALAYGAYWLGDQLNSTWTLDIDGKEIVYSYFIKSQDYGQMSFENNRTDLFVRYKADETGKLKVLIWLEGNNDWSQLFSLPNKQCDFFGYCGRYAICDSRSLGNPCHCLPGYKQVSPDDWANENYLDGCKRITDLQCGETDFKFVEIPHVTLQLY